MKTMVIPASKISAKLVNEYTLQKKRAKALISSYNKKFEEDEEAKKLTTELKQVEQDREEMFKFQEHQLKKQVNLLQQELIEMVKDEDCLRVDNEDGSCMYLVSAKNSKLAYRVLSVSSHQVVALDTSLMGLVFPTQKQQNLYEKYAKLKNQAKQNPKNQKRINAKLEKLYKKDPEFLDKYHASKLQEKLYNYNTNARLKINNDFSSKMSEIDTSAREKIKSLAAKIDTIKKSYMSYAERMAKQRRLQFVKDNIAEISKVAQNLKLKVGEVSSREIAIVVLALEAKTTVQNGKSVKVIDSAKIDMLAKQLEKDLLLNKVNFNFNK